MKSLKKSLGGSSCKDKRGVSMSVLITYHLLERLLLAHTYQYWPVFKAYLGKICICN